MNRYAWLLLFVAGCGTFPDPMAKKNAPPPLLFDCSTDAGYTACRTADWQIVVTDGVTTELCSVGCGGVLGPCGVGCFSGFNYAPLQVGTDTFFWNLQHLDTTGQTAETRWVHHWHGCTEQTP